MTDKSPKNHTEQTAAQAVTGNFQFDVQMPDGKALHLSGYVYDGESVESLNQRLDLMAGVADRQRARAEVPELEKQLVALNDRLRDYREHLNALVVKQQRAPKTLSGQEKQALDQMDLNIKKLTDDIETGRMRIEEVKVTAGLV